MQFKVLSCVRVVKDWFGLASSLSTSVYLLSHGYHVSDLPVMLPLPVQLSRRYNYYAKHSIFYSLDNIVHSEIGGNKGGSGRLQCPEVKLLGYSYKLDRVTDVGQVQLIFVEVVDE